MTRTRFLRALGIAGWDALEPAILAALATESPLLLVGPHGSAKTLLLQRLAEALGLAFRHYNASILSFDDLLGYPVPQDGRLVYLETPATIWQAEAVLFDEVSRCRPELQNKLFPLIHEKVAQGIPLTRLKHRWAAMNPPPQQGARGTFEYEGAEPLDVALADRFAFVLEAPSLDQLERGRPKASPPRPGPPERDAAQDAPGSRRAHEGRRSPRPSASCARRRPSTSTSSPRSSPPRAIPSPRAAPSPSSATSKPRGPPKARSKSEPKHLEDSFYSAARTSLPDAAWGRPVEGHVLLAAHKAAWEAAKLQKDAPERALLVETDPLKRIALALTLDLPAAEAGAVIADGFSALSRPERLVTSAVLFPRLAAKPDLPGSAIEAVADAYATVARSSPQSVVVRKGGNDWKREILGTKLAELDPSSPRDQVLQNAAVVLMADDERFDLAALKAAWERATPVPRISKEGPGHDGHPRARHVLHNMSVPSTSQDHRLARAPPRPPLPRPPARAGPPAHARRPRTSRQDTAGAPPGSCSKARATPQGGRTERSAGKTCSSATSSRPDRTRAYPTAWACSSRKTAEARPRDPAPTRRGARRARETLGPALPPHPPPRPVARRPDVLRPLLPRGAPMTATAEAHDLVRRVLDAVPARSHALGALLQLFRVEASDDVPTACVSCERRPVLRVNPAFVREHCQTDAHLFVLVMHELHHVLLGHTRLFPRVTPAHNVAFDAVINALLCARFPEEAYTSFFTQAVRRRQGPAPPARAAGKAEGQPARLAALHAALYDGTATAQEVFEAIVREIGDRRRPARPPPRLARRGGRVGHRRPGRPRRHGRHPQDRREVAPAQRPDQGPKPRRRPPDQHGHPARPTDPAVLAATRRALLGAADRGKSEARRDAGPRPALLPLPDPSDRRAHVARELGATPVLYRSTLLHAAAEPREPPPSTSTSAARWTRGSRTSTARSRPSGATSRADVHLFSTKVETIPLAALRDGTCADHGRHRHRLRPRARPRTPAPRASSSSPTATSASPRKSSSSASSAAASRSASCSPPAAGEETWNPSPHVSRSCPDDPPIRRSRVRRPPRPPGRHHRRPHRQARHGARPRRARRRRSRPPQERRLRRRPHRRRAERSPSSPSATSTTSPGRPTPTPATETPPPAPSAPTPDTLDVRTDLCLGPLPEDERAIRDVSDDQSICVGHAVWGPRAGHRPLEQALATDFAQALERLRSDRPELGLGPDGKTLVVVRNQTLVGVSLSIQHAPAIDWLALTREARSACETVAQEYVEAGELTPLTQDTDWLVNGAGAFEIGGPEGDNGLSGKKLVAQSYGSAVPIGGGATFGKDPSKVDPRGQALARELALKEVLEGRAREATVWLAYRPGDVAPRWVEVLTVPVAHCLGTI